MNLRLWGMVCAFITASGGFACSSSYAFGTSRPQPCPQPQPQCLPVPRAPSDPTPGCGIEITCTDKPVQLGYSDGICFRATCPGIWAMLHRRVDQASFRRRIWTYRHFTFKGYWELKDQGAIQSGPVEIREVFLVAPDDLIEFRLRDPDPYARVEFRNIGYLKRADLCELKKWVAWQSFREGPALIQAARDRWQRECKTAGGTAACNRPVRTPFNLGDGFLGGLVSTCRHLGLPF